MTDRTERLVGILRREPSSLTDGELGVLVSGNLPPALAMRARGEQERRLKEAQEQADGPRCHRCRKARARADGIPCDACKAAIDAEYDAAVKANGGRLLFLEGADMTRVARGLRDEGNGKHERSKGPPGSKLGRYRSRPERDEDVRRRVAAGEHRADIAKELGSSVALVDLIVKAGAKPAAIAPESVRRPAAFHPGIQTLAPSASDIVTSLRARMQVIETERALLAQLLAIYTGENERAG